MQTSKRLANEKTLQVFKPVFSNNKIHLSYVDCALFYGNLIVSKGQEGKIVV